MTAPALLQPPALTDAQAEWARCRDWIAAALDRDGFYGIDDIERGIAEGEMTFWPGRDCAVVSEFITYPKMRVLNVLAGGGVRGRALRELTQEMEPALVQWARAGGASKIIGFGSYEGWQPVCARMGYRHLWTVMQKDIT